MKKSLIALAVAAALPVSAMAASNITMYGIADIFVGFQDDDRAGGDGGMVVNSGGQSTSRLGVRGSEDLGGGLSATFQFEGALNTDTGTPGGLTFRRRSIVGIKGGFGHINFGRNYSPIFWTALSNDMGGMAHSINDWVGGAGGSTGRWDNGIHYNGQFGGIRVYAAYAPDETAADEDGAGIAARGTFGPVGIGAGFQTDPTTGVENTHIGANVKFGAMGFGFNLQNIQPAAAGSADSDAIGVSASLKVGASGSVLLNVRDVDGQDTAFQIFYRQGLSKRTNWYAGFLDFGGVEGGADNGTEFRVGVRHRF